MGLLQRFWSNHRLATIICLALLFIGLLLQPWSLVLVLAVAFGGQLLGRLESLASYPISTWRRKHWIVLSLVLSVLLLALAGGSSGRGALILALMPVAWVLVTDQTILQIGKENENKRVIEAAAAEPPTPLIGGELLAKIKQLGDVSKSDLVRDCGYFSIKQDGSERLNFTAFYEALLNAKGVESSSSNNEDDHEGDDEEKSIYIKTEPGGHVLFGKLSEEQVDELRICINNQELSEELSEIGDNSYGQLAECDGVVNSGDEGDFGNEGTITYSTDQPALGPEVEEDDTYKDGVYVVVMKLSKCSIEFDFNAEGGFDEDEFEEISVPIRLPEEIKHGLYGHPDFNIISGFKFRGNEVEEYEGEVEDRGYDTQLTFFSIEDGETHILYSNYNGEEEWAEDETTTDTLSPLNNNNQDASSPITSPPVLAKAKIESFLTEASGTDLSEEKLCIAIEEVFQHDEALFTDDVILEQEDMNADALHQLLRENADCFFYGATVDDCIKFVVTGSYDSIEIPISDLISEGIVTVSPYEILPASSEKSYIRLEETLSGSEKWEFPIIGANEFNINLLKIQLFQYEVFGQSQQVLGIVSYNGHEVETEISDSGLNSNDIGMQAYVRLESGEISCKGKIFGDEFYDHSFKLLSDWKDSFGYHKDTPLAKTKTASADQASLLPQKDIEIENINDINMEITKANYFAPDDGETRYEIEYNITNRSDQIIELLLTRLFVLHPSGLVVGTTEDESEDMAENGESISALSSIYGISVQELDGNVSSAQLMLQVTACSCHFKELGSIECPSTGSSATLKPTDQNNDALIIEAITITAEPPVDGECCISIKALINNNSDLSFPRAVLTTNLKSASGRELEDTYTQEVISPNSQVVIEDSFWGVKVNRIKSAKLHFSLKAFVASGIGIAVSRDLSLEA